MAFLFRHPKASQRECQTDRESGRYADGSSSNAESCLRLKSGVHYRAWAHAHGSSSRTRVSVDFTVGERQESLSWGGMKSLGLELF